MGNSNVASKPHCCECPKDSSFGWWSKSDPYRCDCCLSYFCWTHLQPHLTRTYCKGCKNEMCIDSRKKIDECLKCFTAIEQAERIIASYLQKNPIVVSSKNTSPISFEPVFEPSQEQILEQSIHQEDTFIQRVLEHTTATIPSPHSASISTHAISQPIPILPPQKKNLTLSPPLIRPSPHFESKPISSSAPLTGPGPSKKKKNARRRKKGTPKRLSESVCSNITPTSCLPRPPPPLEKVD